MKQAHRSDALYQLKSGPCMHKKTEHRETMSYQREWPYLLHNIPHDHFNGDFTRKNPFLSTLQLFAEALPTLQGLASLRTLILPVLAASALVDLAEVTKTTTSVTGNITHSLCVHSSRCATASLAALSYQDHPKESIFYSTSLPLASTRWV